MPILLITIALTLGIPLILPFSPPLSFDAFESISCCVVLVSNKGIQLSIFLLINSGF